MSLRLEKKGPVVLSRQNAGATRCPGPRIIWHSTLHDNAKRPARVNAGVANLFMWVYVSHIVSAGQSYPRAGEWSNTFPPFPLHNLIFDHFYGSRVAVRRTAVQPSIVLIPALNALFLAFHTRHWRFFRAFLPRNRTKATATDAVAFFRACLAHLESGRVLG